MKTILKNVEFVLSQEYTDSNSKTATASIILQIDAVNKSFSITPNPKTYDNHFGFMNTSKNNWEMWIAIAQLIEQATIFGNNYVNNLTIL